MPRPQRRQARAAQSRMRAKIEFFPYTPPVTGYGRRRPNNCGKNRPKRRARNSTNGRALERAQEGGLAGKSISATQDDCRLELNLPEEVPTPGSCVSDAFCTIEQSRQRRFFRRWGRR